MSHYVTLTNSASRSIYPKNRGNNFVNQLPRPLDLSDGEWEVALCDIIVPDIADNVSDGTIFWKLPEKEPVAPLLPDAAVPDSDSDDEEEEEEGVVPRGKYTTRGLLLKIKNVTTKKLGLTGTFNETTQKVTITVPVSSYIELSPDISWLLGYGKKGIVIDGKKTAPRTVELRAREDKYFVHADIIEHVPFGDRLLPVLWSSSMSDYKGITIRRYVKVNRQIIDSIKIDIKTLSGSYIDIGRRHVVLVLHFRHVEV